MEEEAMGHGGETVEVIENLGDSAPLCNSELYGLKALSRCSDW